MKKLLLVLMCLCVASVADAATRYISPSGSNSNNGQSTSTPWLTFAHAFSNTSCGDTLLLMDGTYGDGTSTGKINLTRVCTAGNEFTIRALNSRQPKIVDDGTGVALQILDSAYLIVDGIYVRSTDNTAGLNTSNGRPFQMRRSNHVIIRNMIGANPNRYSNSHIFPTLNSQDILLEDNEGYLFHRHCASGWQSERITVRRLYCNPRGGRISGGFQDFNGLGSADSAFSNYPCKDCIIENIIADGTTNAMFLTEMNATFGSGVLMSGTKVLGSICYKCNYETSVYLNSRNNAGINYAPQNILIRDVVTTDYDPNSGQGVRVSDGVNITLDHITVLSDPSVTLTTQHGITLDDGGGAARGTDATQNSATMTNIAVRGVKDRGFNISGFNTWTLNSALSNSNGTAFQPSSSANYTNTATTDPGYGVCKGLWVPAGAPGKGTGVATRTSLGGDDIGATVLYRYVDGVLTDIPLWDTVTKAFPFGAATADGINRVAGQSLFDIHVRLKVGDADCPFPTGYVGGSGGGGGGGGAGNTPSNPANHASGSGTTSASWSHTISGQGLLVAVTAYDSNGNVGTIDTPTSCGGQSVTALSGGEVVTSPPYRRTKLFGITSPTTGSCTISIGVTGAADTVVGESVDIATMGSFGTPAVATGLSSTPSVTVPTDDGETVYAFVGTKCLPSGGVCTTTYDVGPDETWLKDTAGTSDLRLASASQSGNDGGAMTATVGSNNYWTIAGVSIIPGSPDPPSGATLTISGYRIYNGYGTESGASALAAQDTPLDTPIFGMVRIRQQITGSGATTAPTGVRLYCRRNADSFTQAMNTFGSNTFRLIGPAPDSESNRIPATSTATTARLGSSPFVAGFVYNDANATVQIPALTVGDQTELESNVVFDTSAGTMECRYYTDGGVQIPADSGKVPTLTVRSPIFAVP